ncbi:MAG TPA: ABC transporter substrate-binding protein [Myxococcaceae bacterium]|nr:ABC transporter substrate-binding protein [Myxococcaceae bacterium]
MIRTLTRSLTVTLALGVAVPAFAANENVVKPLKTVIGSVRYGKDKAALQQFAADEQGRMLLGSAWDTAKPEQKKEFLELFHSLFAKIAFPKIRQNFEHLGTVLYDEPKVDGDKAQVASTLVIDHPLKKQEMKVKYKLVKDGSAWKVVDVSVLGDSMLEGIRDEQVKPILKEGGIDLLLQRMRQKNKELASVTLK